MKFDDRKITVDKCKDSGLALVLICLIGYLIWRPSLLLILAVIFLVIAMTYPLLFQPFARVWFALSIFLGTIVSKVILAILFYAMVLPVGLVRRAMGKDSMQLKTWKQGEESVFRKREHVFEKGDLEHPY